MREIARSSRSAKGPRSATRCSSGRRGSGHRALPAAARRTCDSHLGRIRPICNLDDRIERLSDLVIHQFSRDERSQLVVVRLPHQIRKRESLKITLEQPIQKGSEIVGWCRVSIAAADRIGPGHRLSLRLFSKRRWSRRTRMRDSTGSKARGRAHHRRARPRSTCRRPCERRSRVERPQRRSAAAERLPLLSAAATLAWPAATHVAGRLADRAGCLRRARNTTAYQLDKNSFHRDTGSNIRSPDRCRATSPVLAAIRPMQATPVAGS